MPSLVPTEFLPPTIRPGPTPFPAETLHLGWVSPEERGALVPELAVGPDGTIYVAGGDGGLEAVSPTGETLWRYQGDHGSVRFLTLDPAEGTLYYVADGRDLHALGTDGGLRWVFPSDLSIFRSIVVPDGSVFLWGQGPDGEASRGFRVSSEGAGEPLTWSVQAGFSVQPVADSSGRLFLWSDGGSLAILSPEGAVLRECEESAPYAAVRGADDVLIYSAYWEGVVARDAECRELWRYPTGGEKDGRAIAVDAGEKVYVGGTVGQVYALSAQGQLLWETEPDPSVGDIEYVAWNGINTLYARGDLGYLMAFDYQGRRLWTHRLYRAGRPWALETTPDGGLAMVQSGRLWLFTGDARLTHSLPDPVPLPQTTQQVEEEVVSYLLKMIEGQIAFVDDRFGSEELQIGPHLIVWAPVKEGSSYSLDVPAKRVWWHEGGYLTHRQDAEEAQVEYWELAGAEYERGGEPEGGRRVGGYYAFGVSSVGAGRDEAKVYLMSRDMVLTEARGYVYTLRRSPSGDWWVYRTTLLWEE
jgi:outer membrane protein assembly factor BamB